MQKWWASNYNFVEKIAFLKNRLWSPSRRNKYGFQKLSSYHSLISKKAESYTILFLGDVMPLSKKQLVLSPELIHFFKDIDILVLNLEGVITAKKRFLALSHDPGIITTLKRLSKNAQLVVNVANNHSGDFGDKDFMATIDFLIDQGIKIVGLKESPSVEFKNIHFYSSSLWSNQKFDLIEKFTLDDASILNAKAKTDKVNVFLPHWGYEMQLYPTIKQIALARSLTNWNLIAGCHSHCPQPFEWVDDNRLVVYSLGNFCYSHYNPNHYCGSILKVNITQFGNIDGSCLQLIEMAQTNENIIIKPIENLKYNRLRIDKMMRSVNVISNLRLSNLPTHFSTNYLVWGNITFFFSLLQSL